MKPKHIAWTLGALGALALMAWFTLRFAAPNEIVAGQKATEKQAALSSDATRWRNRLAGNGMRSIKVFLQKRSSTDRVRAPSTAVW